LFAHVTNTGTLYLHQGATAVTHGGTGSYTVTFDRDLTGCVAFAEVGFAAGATGSLYTDTIARTQIASGTPATAVYVSLLRTSTSSAADGNFNLAVFC
jgi:hypothetical protein